MRSIEKIVNEQIQKWQILQKEREGEERVANVITLSREPGSGGRLIAQGLADRLGFDLFHQEVLHRIAESADVNRVLLETLDERGISVLEDWISSLVHERHLWPDQYLQHLMKVVGTIGRYGRAVVVGRGANFILPRDRRFSVRIVAPRPWRVDNVIQSFGVSKEEATRRVIRAESDRRAFVRKYFNADIANPVYYNMLINTEQTAIEAGVEAILRAFEKQVHS